MGCEDEMMASSAGTHEDDSPSCRRHGILLHHQRSQLSISDCSMFKETFLSSSVA